MEYARILGSMPSCTADIVEIIEITRFCDKARQGIDDCGNKYTKIKGEWIRKPISDYDIAIKALDEEYPGMDKVVV